MTVIRPKDSKLSDALWEIAGVHLSVRTVGNMYIDDRERYLTRMV